MRKTKKQIFNCNKQNNKYNIIRINFFEKKILIFLRVI